MQAVAARLSNFSPLKRPRGKNGTFVGDQRVEGPRSFGDGDIIGAGSLKLTAEDTSDAELNQDRAGMKGSSEEVDARVFIG